MSTISDLAYAWFSSQAGVPTGLSITDEEVAFYNSVVSNPAGHSVADLERAYYIGVLGGSIPVGGGGGGSPVSTTTITPTPGFTGTIVLEKYSDGSVKAKLNALTPGANFTDYSGTVPVGYRPPSGYEITYARLDGAAMIIIKSNGLLTIRGDYDGSLPWNGSFGYTAA